MSVTPLESDGRAAASKAERAGSIPARGTPHRASQIHQAATGWMVDPLAAYVPAEASCEITHKAFPRKRLLAPPQDRSFPAARGWMDRTRW